MAAVRPAPVAPADPRFARGLAGSVHADPLDPRRCHVLAIGVDQRITEEQRELVRKSSGLDRPQPVQYLRWLEHVVQGDLGTSLRTRRTVNEELRLRLPVTLQLTVFAAILGTIPALVVGIGGQRCAATRRWITWPPSPPWLAFRFPTFCWRRYWCWYFQYLAALVAADRLHQPERVIP